MGIKQKGCYNNLTEQIDMIETKIGEIRNSLADLKKTFLETNIEETAEEICQDEIDADAAAMEAVREICLESLLDIDSKGEA
tara:strand:- start:105 stop:350 length:246 start_codon:yes stop_codon:yes gene_type:complete